MRLGDEREHLAVGQLLDHVLVALSHHLLEVLAHSDDVGAVARVHHRLLERCEAAAAQHADDDVVERVGLGFERPAAVVLAHHLHDPR